MSKKSFMKAALEEMEQEKVVAQIEQDNQQPNEPEQQSEQVTAIDDAEKDIDEHINCIEDVVCDVYDIQDIADFTEDAQQEGIDSTTAEILDLATESLYERLGVRPSVAQYAAESFGSKSTRVHSTKLAIEGFKEFIKTMWEVIKAAFKKMGLYLLHYAKVVFSLNTQTIKTANALRDKIKKTPVSAQNTAYLNDKKLKIRVTAGMLALVKPEDTSSINFNTLSEDLQKSALVVVSSSKLVNTFSSYLSRTSDLKELISTEEKFNQIAYPDLEEGFKNTDEDVPSYLSGLVAKDKNIQYYKSGDMIGARAIYVALPKGAKGTTGKQAILAIEETSIKLAGSGHKDSPVQDGSGTYQTDALSHFLYADIIKTVVFVSEKVSESEKGHIDLINMHDKMVKEIDAVEQMLGQNEKDYKDYKDRVSSIRTFANSVNRLTGELVKAISGSLVKSCHASIKLVDASYNAYMHYQ